VSNAIVSRYQQADGNIEHGTDVFSINYCCTMNDVIKDGACVEGAESL
jgi:hypothetical protein